MGKSRADERPFWTLEEFESFIDAVSDKYEAWVAFQILFWTGMRIGELLALKVEDIDLDDLTVRIDESYTRLNKNREETWTWAGNNNYRDILPSVDGRAAKDRKYIRKGK